MTVMRVNRGINGSVILMFEINLGQFTAYLSVKFGKTFERLSCDLQF